MPETALDHPAMEVLERVVRAEPERPPLPDAVRDSLFVVIAAFNESAVIGRVVSDVLVAYPNVVVVDKGTAASMTSTTLTEDVYAIPFGQKGLMAGLGLEGSKITRIHQGP